MTPELSQVEALTNDLFPGKATIRKDCDADDPADTWFVVEAPARGAVNEIIERELLWHDRLRALLGDEAADFRLVVIPQ